MRTCALPTELFPHLENGCKRLNSFPVSAKFFFIKVQYSQRDLNPQNLLPAQQLFLCSLHGLKIETIYHFLHQSRDFIVAKVSDTAFMGMVYLFAVREVFRLQYPVPPSCRASRKGIPSRAKRLTSSTLKISRYLSSSRICSFTLISFIM